tara:strand:+ start:666 stop:1391 length:726 start_codon:yes stop_codon:yes gene_type:complete
MSTSSDASLDITEVIAKFPNFRVGIVICKGLNIPSSRNELINQFVRVAEREAVESLVDLSIAELPEVKCWRDAYKKFGVKKTSYRSSIERLVKKVVRDRSLPCVNGMVDLYNAVSLRWLMPIGADDLDKVCLPLTFRAAHGDESFVPLGSIGISSPPKKDEIIYADSEKCLCRRWNWYQNDFSAIRPDTNRAVLTIQALAPNNSHVQAAANQLGALLEENCGAESSVKLADKTRPFVRLEL